jgi:hypothetical protein
MKRYFFLCFLCCIILLSFSGCKKEPVVGPQGPVGPIGPNGNTGNTKVKIYYFTARPGAWAGTGAPYNYIYYDDLIPSEYIPILFSDSCVINVYMDVDTSASHITWSPLPYVRSGEIFSFQKDSPSNFLDIFISKYDGTVPSIPGKDINFKVAIIPKQ